jgi:hypothetical protein
LVIGLLLWLGLVFAGGAELGIHRPKQSRYLSKCVILSVKHVEQATGLNPKALVIGIRNNGPAKRVL